MGLGPVGGTLVVSSFAPNRASSTRLRASQLSASVVTPVRVTVLSLVRFELTASC